MNKHIRIIITLILIATVSLASCEKSHNIPDTISPSGTTNEVTTSAPEIPDFHRPDSFGKFIIE